VRSWGGGGLLATEKVVTFLPLASTRSSWLRVRRPVSRTLFTVRSLLAGRRRLGYPPSRDLRRLSARPPARDAWPLASANGATGPMSSKTIRFARAGEPECPVCGAGWCHTIDERHLENLADGSIVPRVDDLKRHWWAKPGAPGRMPKNKFWAKDGPS
jgi:hypothetical protein